METWTIAKFSTVLNMDSRRVAKALSILDNGKKEGRSIAYLVAQGLRAIHADLLGFPPPNQPNEQDAYFQFRHGLNLARDALETLMIPEAANHIAALWREVLRLEARFDD